MHTWLSHSLIRYYPTSQPVRGDTLTLEAGRGEQVSFQVVFRTGDGDLKVAATASGPDGLAVQVRRVGYVPMPHLNTATPLEEVEGADRIPGFVPDPLFPDTTVHAGPHETHAFWVTVRIPADADAGRYEVPVALVPEGEAPATLATTLVVHPGVAQPRRDFPVTHWFYADALLDWYGLEPFEERFWRILDPYLANVAAHGQDTISVPMLTSPTDGVKRPTQLLGVRREGERYTFDWRLVRRWVDAARARGLGHFEWTHLFTQWGVRHAIRVYENHGETGTLLWPPETGATSPTYRDFLSQLLPEFERFLRAEDLLPRSFFHLSDEPHGEEHLANYQAARAMLRELAPWMRVMDALTDIRYAREGLTDTPIPLLTTAPDFVREGFSPWTYYCCSPRGRYLNRLLDTPLAKIRMSGWLFYRTRVRGFLHWGYNYWYKRQTTELIDPYTVGDARAWPRWAYGDPFVVYPGPDGPVDSLRWEVFAESLQDYALLQAVGMDPDDPSLSAISDFADFPRDGSWVLRRRAELLARLETGVRS